LPDYNSFLERIYTGLPRQPTALPNPVLEERLLALGAGSNAAAALN
jgi:hypothetical protein